MASTGESHTQQKPRIHYGLIVLGLIVLIVFGSLGLGRFGYTSVLPAMQDSMKLTNVQTGALQSWNLVGYLSAVVFVGLLASRFGPRVVIAISLLITGTALVFTGLIPTYDGARLGRFLAGVGGAGGNIPAMGLVSAWFGVRRRGVASGVAVTGSSLGLMVTGPLVPFVLNLSGPEGWRLCWYILGTTTIAISVVCASFLRNGAQEMHLRPLGEFEAERAGSDTGDSASQLRWSLVWRSGVLWRLAAVYFAYGFSYIIYTTFFIRYLVKENGFGREEAGTVWLLIGLVSGISGFIWGAVSDKWGRRFGLICVFVLQSLSFLVLGLWHGPLGVWLSAGLFALTAWSVPALMAALSGDVFGARLAPAALGLMTIVFGAGQALGPWFAGQIADATHSFAPTFVLASLVALFWGAGGSLLLKPFRPSK